MAKTCLDVKIIMKRCRVPEGKRRGHTKYLTNRLADVRTAKSQT